MELPDVEPDSEEMFDFGTWDRPGELAWVAHYLPGVRSFFAAVAKDGDAVICWLD
ncbi:hypothetical protein [Micromonospora zingiberis]|uniref:hypothetical protein n=1 Tax=Micromonospora zingiberis TaxID=2053011 RepID=UPI001F115754|nr:hypothetical protein [Micromonospora zingiberis]